MIDDILIDDMDKLMGGFIVLLIAAAIGLGIMSSRHKAEAERQFKAEVQAEYCRCIEAGRSEFECKAYTNTMEAKHLAAQAKESADDAETAALIGIAAGSVGRSK